MARLPIPGSDNEVWGDVLNQFLRVELDSDGTLRRGDEITQAVSDASSARTKADSAVQSVNSKVPNSSGAVVLTAADISGVPDDNLIVHKSGTETITGDKNFSGALTKNGSAVEVVSAKGQAGGYAPLSSSSLVPPANIASGTATATTYLRGDQAWSTLPLAAASTSGTLQLAGDLAGTSAAPTVPGLAAKANSSDVTVLSDRVTSLEGVSIDPVGTDTAFFGDIFSSVERRSCSSQETLSAGYETFSGGVSPRTFVANSLRFHVRIAAPVGRVITFALYVGTSRTALAKQAEMTVTGSLSTLGIKEVALSSAVSITRGNFVYLGMITTGSGSPDPALSTTDLVPSELLNPAPGVIITAYRSGQSSLPAVLNVNNGYTADGRIFWFALI